MDSYSVIGIGNATPSSTSLSSQSSWLSSTLFSSFNFFLKPYGTAFTYLGLGRCLFLALILSILEIVSLLAITTRYLGTEFLSNLPFTSAVGVALRTHVPFGAAKIRNHSSTPNLANSQLIEFSIFVSVWMDGACNYGALSDHLMGKCARVMRGDDRPAVQGPGGNSMIEIIPIRWRAILLTGNQSVLCVKWIAKEQLSYATWYAGGLYVDSKWMAQGLWTSARWSVESILRGTQWLAARIIEGYQNMVAIGYRIAGVLSNWGTCISQTAIAIYQYMAASVCWIAGILFNCGTCISRKTIAIMVYIIAIVSWISRFPLTMGTWVSAKILAVCQYIIANRGQIAKYLLQFCLWVSKGILTVFWKTVVWVLKCIVRILCFIPRTLFEMLSKIFNVFFDPPVDEEEEPKIIESRQARRKRERKEARARERQTSG
ncbi:hypothetical protein SBOR_9181 [Sclerotinia borealis F-4128]|uniref:Uncharacterized protein n=1 Tax=Sclerotinia borealis (strain F-4128) TaxID=1432307 RepID=W9C412_SCLBF|nr:hypothetical protein SBOR_9181 [Sclerotinia borealis F-4128]